MTILSHFLLSNYVVIIRFAFPRMVIDYMLGIFSSPQYSNTSLYITMGYRVHGVCVCVYAYSIPNLCCVHAICYTAIEISSNYYVLAEYCPTFTEISDIQ